MAEEGTGTLEGTVATSPGAAAAIRGGATPAAADAARKTDTRKATEYVVFSSESRDGPFTLIDTYITQGQTNAKREGAKTVGIDEAEKFFFTAIPTSSFRPEKPSITLQISFATEEDDAPEGE